jgi:hypothetical protein
LENTLKILLQAATFAVLVDVIFLPIINSELSLLLRLSPQLHSPFDPCLPYMLADILDIFFE